MTQARRAFQTRVSSKVASRGHCGQTVCRGNTFIIEVLPVKMDTMDIDQDMGPSPLKASARIGGVWTDGRKVN